mmetsp:Transcript_26662/g.50674  ORF Transcript_26662/g.50674 Transcript_26662/m.50674 type:complete len:212 (+) Transcript_26662:171-806(+)
MYKARRKHLNTPNLCSCGQNVCDALSEHTQQHERYRGPNLAEPESIVGTQRAGLAWVVREPDVAFPRRHAQALEPIGATWFAKYLFGLVVAQGGHHHALVATLPVHRGGHLVPHRELQRVNYTEHFREVPACGGGVEDGGLERLVWPNDEHSTAGHRQASCGFFVWVEHAVEGSDGSIRVRDDGVRDGFALGPLGGLDVFDPCVVRIYVVA